jgi:hypothetical protein
VGQAGDSKTFTFSGTAVAVCGIMDHNGLKWEAELDGEAVS